MVKNSTSWEEEDHGGEEEYGRHVMSMTDLTSTRRVVMAMAPQWQRQLYIIMPCKASQAGR